MGVILEVVFGFIAEVLGYIIGELLFKAIVIPIIKSLGTCIRWLFFLGAKPWGAVWKEDNNTTVGTLFMAAIITILVGVLS